MSEPTLADLATKRGKIIGVAYRSTFADGDPCYEEVAVTEFNSLTTEIGTMMNTIEPEAGVFDFREADAVKRMREANLQPLRDALGSQGVPAADVDVYCNALMDDGAIEGAMNWYRATGLKAGEVAPVTAPTLYVWGSDDATVGRRAAELTAEYVKGRYRFEEIAGAGHFVVDQFPDQVNALLFAHIGSGKT